MKKRISQSVCLLFIVLLSLSSYAQVSNTTSVGNWSNGGTWDNGVPADGGNSTVDHSVGIDQDITIEGSCVVNTFLTDPTGGSSFKAEIKNSGAFTLNDDVTFEGEVKLQNNSTTIVNGCAVFTTGDLLVENNSSLTIAACAKLIVNGTLTIKNNIGITCNGEIEVNGDVNASNNSSVVGTGSLTATGCVSFANSATLFGSSSDCCTCFFGNPLPVELISFEAEIDNTSVKLIWQTAAEINNDYFTLERSNNGLDFEVLAEIAGSGNSNSIIEYSQYDDSPLVGTSYYRIKQTDFDGKFEYVDLLAINFNQDDDGVCSLNVYPNPCVGSCTINLQDCPLEDSQVDVELYDAFGKKIVNRISPKSKTQDISFHLNTSNNLSPGVYIVRASTDGKDQASKVIIK